MRSCVASQRVSPNANSTSPTAADQTTWWAQPSVSPASRKPRSSSRPPRNCVLFRSMPEAHWIENATSSETRSSELCGSGPSRSSKYRSKYVTSRHHPRSDDSVGPGAHHRQGTTLEELGHRRELVDAIGPVPLPHAVAEAEHRPAQEPRVLLGQGARLHRPR